jgi:hypothetical protein
MDGKDNLVIAAIGAFRHDILEWTALRVPVCLSHPMAVAAGQCFIWFLPRLIFSGPGADDEPEEPRSQIVQRLPPWTVMITVMHRNGRDLPPVFRPISPSNHGISLHRLPQ